MVPCSPLVLKTEFQPVFIIVHWFSIYTILTVIPFIHSLIKNNRLPYLLLVSESTYHDECMLVLQDWTAMHMLMP